MDVPLENCANTSGYTCLCTVHIHVRKRLHIVTQISYIYILVSHLLITIRPGLLCMAKNYEDTVKANYVAKRALISIFRLRTYIPYDNAFLSKFTLWCYFRHLLQVISYICPLNREGLPKILKTAVHSSVVTQQLNAKTSTWYHSYYCK